MPELLGSTACVVLVSCCLVGVTVVCLVVMAGWLVVWALRSVVDLACSTASASLPCSVLFLRHSAV